MFMDLVIVFNLICDMRQNHYQDYGGIWRLTKNKQ